MTKENAKLCDELRRQAQQLRRAGTVIVDGEKWAMGVYAYWFERAVGLIEEQDITIRALMGEFGDSCEVGKEGECDG